MEGLRVLRSPQPSVKLQHGVEEHLGAGGALGLVGPSAAGKSCDARQADLLERICADKLRKAEELREAGALAHAYGEPTSQKGKKKSKP